MEQRKAPIRKDGRSLIGPTFLLRKPLLATEPASTAVRAPFMSDRLSNYPKEQNLC